MDQCFFVSDLHGKIDRYEKLFARILEDRPSLVFLGGDLLPHGIYKTPEADFTRSFLFHRFSELKRQMGQTYPLVLMILGNDDPGSEACIFEELERDGVWKYINLDKIDYEEYTIYGYSYIPPSPFRFKDWDRYDVSRYVDLGCISPEEGIRTVDPGCDIAYTTIKQELNDLTEGDDLSKAIFLFHSPPYQTYLDRAALDGKRIDHVPLDVHVGSIAIKRMIEEKQPWVTLHGHIHESTRLTGYWKQEIGRTHLFGAAHDGPELSLVVFEIGDPQGARRLLL